MKTKTEKAAKPRIKQEWRVLFISCLSLLILVTTVIWLRSDRRAIKSAFYDTIESIETENLIQLSNHISDQYRDDLGYSKGDIVEIAKDAIDMLEAINISVETLEIVLAKDKVELEVAFKVVATVEGQRGYLLGNPQRPETAHLWVTKESNEWRIVKVSYPRLQGTR